jgi:hypothetical protein
MRQRIWWNCLLGAALGTVLAGGNCLAAFTSNFETDPIGSPPAGWTISGTNGSTATANVALEGGANQFLAYRDLASAIRTVAARTDGPEASGFLEFDVRFNQGIDSEMNVLLNMDPVGANVIQLQWFHNFYNTNLPLRFRAVLDGYQSDFLSENFPIGSWETIRVEFVATGTTPSSSRGIFTVNWDGVTITNSYKSHGFSGQLLINQLSLSQTGPDATTASVDFDNIQFIPEPSAAVLLALGAVPFWRRR